MINYMVINVCITHIADMFSIDSSNNGQLLCGVVVVLMVATLNKTLHIFQYDE